MCWRTNWCGLPKRAGKRYWSSSGAVGAGVAKLGLSERPQSISILQAVAAIGQISLIEAYEQAFVPLGRHAGQVLLTAGDLRRRSGYLNVRNTLRQIHNYGAIAIVNENDSVAVAELRTTFGDNDRLAANVAGLLPQAMVVILSDMDGLYEAPPRTRASKVIETVPVVDKSVLGWPRTRKRGQPRRHDQQIAGGPIGHLARATTLIAPGRDDHVLDKILAAETVGTLFLPGKRGRCVAVADGSDRPRDLRQLFVDAGAREAISSGGASLLAVGIREVEGQIPAGAIVAICSLDGVEIARGLTNYRSEEMRSIRGVASEDIVKMLGHCPHDAVVHRDNMVISEASRRAV